MPSASCRENQFQPAWFGASWLVAHSWSNQLSPATSTAAPVGRRQAARRLHSRERVITRGVAFPLGFLADAVLALDHARLLREEQKLQRPSFVRGGIRQLPSGCTASRQSSIQASGPGAPSPKPASPKAPRETFWEKWNLSPATSEMAKWANLKSLTRNREAAGSRSRDHPLAKPGDLVAELPAIRRAQAAGEIPPLRLEARDAPRRRGERHRRIPGRASSQPPAGSACVARAKGQHQRTSAEKYAWLFIPPCSAAAMGTRAACRAGSIAASMAAPMIQSGVVAMKNTGSRSSMVQPKKALFTTQVSTMARHSPEATPTALATAPSSAASPSSMAADLPARAADGPQDADLPLPLDDERGEREEQPDDGHDYRDGAQDSRDGESLVEDREDAAAQRGIGVNQQPATAAPAPPAPLRDLCRIRAGPQVDCGGIDARVVPPAVEQSAVDHDEAPVARVVVKHARDAERPHSGWRADLQRIAARYRVLARETFRNDDRRRKKTPASSPGPRRPRSGGCAGSAPVATPSSTGSPPARRAVYSR